MNSLTTKIILAACAFLMIISLFLPYAQIPAIDNVRDVNIENKAITFNVGKEVETVNLISEFCNGQAYLMFSDKDQKKQINPAALKTDTQGVNDYTYYIQFYIYAFDSTASERKISYLPLETYTVNLKKGDDPAVQPTATVDKRAKLIRVSTPNTATFDFSRIISPKSAWAQYSSKRMSTIEKRAAANEVTNIALVANTAKEVYMAFTVESPAESKSYALDMYTMTIIKDGLKQSVPTVCEFGLGLERSGMLSSVSGEFTTSYKGDTLMFVGVILAAFAVLGSFLIKEKIRIIELILAVIPGILFIVVPILDNMLYITSNSYLLDLGWYCTIGIGVATIAAAVLDFIVERKEYKAEQIRLYGKVK